MLLAVVVVVDDLNASETCTQHYCAVARVSCAPLYKHATPQFLRLYRPSTMSVRKILGQRRVRRWSACDFYV